MNNRKVPFKNEELILVNEKDEIIGYETKAKCHEGEGLLHRAFSIFIFNSKNELLIQKRSNKKLLWHDYWSNSCCSHPRKGETMEIATQRRLFEELGLENPLKFEFKFQYQDKFKNIGSERELCYVFTGYNDKLPIINQDEISDWRYINKQELLSQINKKTDMFTPWFLLELEKLKW